MFWNTNVSKVQSAADYDLFEHPGHFGIAPSALVRLDSPSHYAQVPYLDLVEKSTSGLGVIEDQGNPVVYLLNQAPVEASVNAYSLESLIQTLACRADARYLAVAQPGRLAIYPIGLAMSANPVPVRAIDLRTNPSGLHEFLTGANPSPSSRQEKQEQADAKWLDLFLFDLLNETARQLKETSALTDSQILSLVGRGLFMRFIADRRIIQDADANTIAGNMKVQSISALFDTSRSLAYSCEWLDRIFNGNLLPLLENESAYPSAADYLDFFSGERLTVCSILSNILHSAPAGQRQLGWHSIQFQHVPADMLSQVYEHFAHAHQLQQAKRDSVHYTPRHIAQQLVNAAFAGTSLEDKSRAQVLDPAVGAGVFLVLAFKRLVQERWKVTGKRPNREVIRAILHEQLCGLDINAESLKFAALSLYLTALELDPLPAPLSDLKFEPLDGLVLRNVGRCAPLGSLHQDAAPELSQRFDMVLGNPPWTKPKGQSNLIKDYSRIVRECALNAGIPTSQAEALRVEQGNPDVVFVWRSLAWAKPDGMLAFALHAQHMLFQKGDSFKLRQALLQCVEVSGILNGSSLRGTAIWPNHAAPFCLWVAKNKKPTAQSAFYYLKPYLEKSLLAREQYRMDPQDAIVVSQSIAAKEQFLFKALHRGEGLAWRVLEQITRVCSRYTLADYWSQSGLRSGNGFKAASGQQDASSLLGLPMLETKNWTQGNVTHRYFIDFKALPKFGYESLDRIRDVNIYKAPLVLFHQSPAVDCCDRVARIALHDVAYSASFNGYSCGIDEIAIRRAQYLQILSLSDVFWFVMLMTSAKFGVERPVLQKDDIDALPLIPLERLSPQDQKTMEALSASLHTGEEPRVAVNQWVQTLYKLSDADARVMCDTLAVGMPFAANEQWASAQPEPGALSTFASIANQIIEPFAKVSNTVAHVQADFNAQVITSGWRFLRITFGLTPDEGQQVLPRTWVESLALADRFWASQVQVHAAPGVLWFGQLAQNRYWTKTRARVFAAEVLQTALGQYLSDADVRSNQELH